MEFQEYESLVNENYSDVQRFYSSILSGVNCILPDSTPPPFDPIKYGLDSKFRLNLFTNLKIGNYKVPETASNATHKDLQLSGNGIRCFIKTLHRGLSLFQKLDLIYTVINDPYLIGKIACANALSNFYAVGIVQCDAILMMLSVSNSMTEKEKTVVMPLMLKGFQDAAKIAEVEISDIHTFYGSSSYIGGMPTSICSDEFFIIPKNAIVGDVLVLTKPLGTWVAINAYRSLDEPEFWNKINMSLLEEDVRKAYDRALECMTRLNKTASDFLHTYEAHAAINVGEGGLLGHAKELAAIQTNEVSFVIHNLPIISKLHLVSKMFPKLFPLNSGECPEISGGLLICLPRDQAAVFCKEIEKLDGGHQSWIIGIVEHGPRTAKVIERPRFINVPVNENT